MAADWNLYQLLQKSWQYTKDLSWPYDKVQQSNPNFPVLPFPSEMLISPSASKGSFVDIAACKLQSQSKVAIMPAIIRLEILELVGRLSSRGIAQGMTLEHWNATR